jgi:bacterioferritin-associated ferredoxin
MSSKTLFCRCEDVTLAEVEAAFAAGHCDIESLKRYTGFATGWCQGKQCLVLCARFLAERTGAMPEAPITPRPPLHPIPLGQLAKLANVMDRGERATPAPHTSEPVATTVPSGEGEAR